MVMISCDLVHHGNVMVHSLEALLVGLVYGLVTCYGTYLRLGILYISDIEEHS
jgi:hypothetical protein